jgi:DNA processing protein
MSLRRLSDAERRDWVRLVRTQNIVPLTFARLLERLGNLALARPDAAAIVGARNASAAGRKIARDRAAR